MTRRTLHSLLLGSPLLAAGRGVTSPSERLRYADPATEGEVFRLTSPSVASVLPAAGHHCMSSRNNFLVHCSDRSGSWQLHRLELKKYQTSQLTEDQDVLVSSPAMTSDERNIFYAAGHAVRSVAVNGSRDRQWAQAHGPITAFNVTEDGLFATVVAANQLSLMPLLTKAAPKLLGEGAALDFLLPRPRRASLLYRNGASWHLAHFDGTVNRVLAPMEGSGAAQWSADGRTILYLKGSAITELDPDTRQEQTVAKTSAFAQFTRNANGTVFAGLSGSKAQPHVLLLLRLTRRERTVSEHKSSTVAAPFFSPNSQQLFYQSDRDGKPAIYMVATDKLLEKTDDESSI